MAYDLKSVFYLDTSATITKATAGGGSAQLDLSAYIDPIARGRQKGTGLAIYKTHYAVTNVEDANEVAPEASETGVMSYGLIAGAGTGDITTGNLQIPAGAFTFDASNQLLVSAGNFYGAGSAATSTPVPMDYMMPSKDVPYVIVRDNVCLQYCVSDSQKFESNSTLSVRLECAIITLDQATLNQLLRTQTV
tara:strand:+ start:502 stop:1077 length:576 start_codon:yes stop_codon:yes gene_type:complete